MSNCDRLNGGAGWLSCMQDNPVVDDLKATLEYDMTSHLSEPRWMDGLQQFLGIGYEAGLAVIVDVR